MTTTLTYDALDRLTGKQYDTSHAPQVAATAPVTYTYDAGANGKGRRTGMADGSGSTGWEYDPAGWALTETKVIASQSYLTSYGYDALGRLESMTYPDGEVVTTTYQAQGLPATVAGQDLYLSNAEYNVLGRPTDWALGGVLTQALSYDPGTFRLNGLSAVNAGGATLQSLDLAFDPLGRLDGYTDALAGFSLDHAYDPLNRLDGVTSEEYGQDYSYDTIGNLTLRGGLVLTYEHATQPHAVTAWGDTAYQYDANGNRVGQSLTGGGVVTYTYDAENRLTQVISATGGSVLTTTFLYDGDGRRALRLGADGQQTVYVGDTYELTLGEAGGGGESWGTDQIVPASGAAAYAPDVAVGPDGRVYVVWQNEDEGTRSILLQSYDPATGGWGASQQIDVETANDVPNAPAVAVDSQGVIYVAWQVDDTSGIDGMYLRRYACEDGEGEPIWCEVEPIPGGDEKGGPAIALVGQTVYVAFHFTDESDYFVYVARSAAMDEWTIDTIIGSSNVIHSSALSADSQGNLYLAWSEQSGTDDIVYAARRDVDTGNWSDAEPLSNLGADSRNPHLAVGPLDNVIATWTVGEAWEPSDIYYSERPAGDAALWSTPALAAQGLGWGGIGDVVIDVDNRACLIYLTDEEGQDQSLQVRCAAQEDRAGEELWEDWADVSDQRIDNDDLDFVAPSLAVGPDAHLYAAWSEPDRQGSGERYIYFDAGGAATKYYLLGGQRVAMRRGNQVYYLHGDHLGSTTLTTDENGNVVAEARYLPYGGLRWENGAMPTDFTFTGQRREGFGLMDYQARYYDPRLGRFISPDSVVSDPSNPQNLNRYSYVNGNPLRYRDPSGHYVCEDEYGNCRPPSRPNRPPMVPLDQSGLDPGIPVSPFWTEVSQMAGVGSIVADTTATAFSIGGIIVEGLVVLGVSVPGTVEPLPVEEAASVIIAYKLYTVGINRAENVLSAVGTGFTAFGDWAGGYTYYDFETHELVIGQNTVVSAMGFFIGNQNLLTLEGVGDTLVNLGILAYDIGSLSGKIPINRELRIYRTAGGSYYGYLKRYPD